ncbi:MULTISPECIES: hypothetical protein [Deinococcus]|uniref:Uncharacterized protein n=1 Tax=Deinococcus daejeonensis TaxID=1007098 RepID=A0ABQ2J0W3_9DEIO|nr:MULTISPECIES: hypothetical protein [Deinococcus]NTY00873.1 hypothetical protein [Deinococcus sp. JMULE3]RIX96494.1 hypothetical protein D3W47_20240 [Deinococcus sp. RM]GGN37110.1 hypothetical protein GCM10010842_18670 [Deinococcus daejeonensis]
MSAASTLPCDIVSLRMSHCRAEHAAREAQYHLAVLHYRTCLEAAERREDCRAVEFFALKLAGCYDQMGLNAKAASFRALAGSGDAPLLG